MYELGPVEPDIVRALEERRIEERWPPAKQQPWHETRRAPDGREAFFLTHVDGHCVFLRDDALCAVHGLFGAEAKPAFCREYPFHVLDDPHGAVVVVRPSCSSLHETSRTGRPLEEYVPEILALPRIMGRRRFAPTSIQVLPSVDVPLQTWLAWEQALEAVVDPAVDPETTVARVRARLFELAATQGFDPGPAPTPSPRIFAMAGGAVVEGLRRLMGRVVDEAEPGADRHRVAFAAEMREILDAALPRLHAPEPRAFSQEALDYQHQLLRTFLLSRGFAAIGGYAEGLGAFLLQTAVARAVAHLAEEGTIDAANASAVIVRWNRFTENPTIGGILRKARPALLDLFLHASPR
jgi:hypothetical protein